MLLYSSPFCCTSHRVRLVLAEKAIEVKIIDADAATPPEDLLDLNPYGSLPTLVDRDLVLYDSRVIIEYLDERFPHPPLLPSDPGNRARFRLALSRIENDWYSLLPGLQAEHAALSSSSGQRNSQKKNNNKRNYNKLRKQFAEELSAATSLFNIKPFFMSEALSLLDCSLAPLLWRLPYYAIELPKQAQIIHQYGARLFARPAFRNSLSVLERTMVSSKEQ